MTDSKTPEITLFFSMGILGMDEHVTEYVTVPLTDDDSFSQAMQMKAQLAQLKLQTGFLEIMVNQFPDFIAQKAKDEGWELPDSLQ